MPWRQLHRSSLSSPPAAKAIAKIGSTMTYDDVPCIVEERNDNCPYLGHVPNFAPNSPSREQRNR